RGGDPRPHERASLPLRHLSARDAGDPTGGQRHGGSAAMTIHSDLPFSRRDLLKGGGALVIEFHLGGAASPALAARGDVAGPPDPGKIDSWIAVHADNTATI